MDNEERTEHLNNDPDDYCSSGSFGFSIKEVALFSFIRTAS